jgi:hypothetical protein
MTGTPSILADLLADLLADCNARGIRLSLADGYRLAIDAPQDALTPDLLGRLKEHKGELRVMLRPAPELAPINQADAAAVWQSALDRLEGDPLFPPHLMEALRAADSQWADDTEAGEAGESTEVSDPPAPCPECGTLELWESLAGDWRCLRCDPPTKARRLRERMVRLNPTA